MRNNRKDLFASVSIEEAMNAIKGISNKKPENKSDQQLLRQEALRAASVVGWYTEISLATEPNRAIDLFVSIIADSYEVKVAHKTKYQLHKKRRLRAVNEMIAEANLDSVLLSHPPHADDELGRILQKVLSNKVELDSTPIEKLPDLLKVVDWLSGIEGLELPSKKDIEMRISKERLLATLNFLAGEHFEGRKKELARLRETIGIRDPESIWDGLTRHGRELFGVQSTPVSLYGPGGVGKSTLMAKLLLDHWDSPQAEPLPFMYLDFDREDLDVHDLAGLMIAGIKQLSVQIPSTSDHFNEMVSNLQNQRAEEGLTIFGNEQYTSSVEGMGNKGRWQSDEEDTWQGFASDLQRALELSSFNSQGILLMIFDTFEEVQYENAEIDDFWRFIKQLQSHFSGLRVIFSGRAPLAKQYKTDLMELESLDEPSAKKFLQAKGVQDNGLIDVIIEHLGTNPLTLQLTLDLILKEDDLQKEEIKQIQTQRGWIWKLEESVVQGVLYKRILAHIHDDHVRKLAHPGLALRYITKDLIRQVLAPVCGLPIKTDEEARDIYNKLVKEVSLVSIESSGALKVRTELRQIMVELMRKEDGKLINSVHRRAVKYYKDRKDEKSRSEEIYHRLALGQSRALIDKRWVDGIETYLDVDMPELPASGRTLIASYIENVKLPTEVWEKADKHYNEKRISRIAKRYLKRAEYEKTLHTIKKFKRDDWSIRSPLIPIEIEALVGMKKWPEAIELLDQAIPNFSTRGRTKQRFELLLLKGHINEQPYTADALDALGRATRLIAKQSHGKKARLRVRLAELEAYGVLQEHSNSPETPKLAERMQTARTDILEIIRNFSSRQITTSPSLVMRAAMLLGHEHNAELIEKLAHAGIFPSLSKEQISVIQESLGEMKDEVNDPKGEAQKDFDLASVLDEVQGNFSKKRTNARQVNQGISDLLGAAKKSKVTLESLPDLLKNVTKFL